MRLLIFFAAILTASPSIASPVDDALRRLFNGDGPAVTYDMGTPNDDGASVTPNDETDCRKLFTAACPDVEWKPGEEPDAFIDEGTGELMIRDPRTGVYYAEGTPEELKLLDDVED